MAWTRRAPTNEYVAVVHGRTPQGRRNWRLYAVRSGRTMDGADAVGDYDRLTKVRGMLAYGEKSVAAKRVARDQVYFRVGS